MEFSVSTRSTPTGSIDLLVDERAHLHPAEDTHAVRQDPWRSTFGYTRTPTAELPIRIGWATPGFALVPTFSRPHFSLLLPDLSELTMARLDRCFDAPIPNPGRPGNR
jgi:hypothetical protein